MKRIIICLSMLCVLFLSGCSTCPNCPVCTECEQCKECPTEKALVVNTFNGWGENEENSMETLFSVTTINYGFIEAKDVEVTCRVSKGDKVIFKKSESIGNIASTSYVTKQITARSSDIRETDVMGYCFVSNCSNCELLDMRINELKDLAEK